MKDDREIRQEILTASFKAHACHIGSALSCVELLQDIFSKMKKGDRFLFSKASGACAFYVMLGYSGKKLVEYLKKYPLSSKEVPGVLHSVGSLGHGLPVAVGLALSNRKSDVYVLMGDSELQCGTTWECLLFIRQHGLNNLKIYVDYNGLQACDRIDNILKIPKYFLIKNGFNLIATTKGKGVDFIQNKVGWHYWNLTPELYEKAIFQILNGVGAKRRKYNVSD